MYIWNYEIILYEIVFHRISHSFAFSHVRYPWIASSRHRHSRNLQIKLFSIFGVKFIFYLCVIWHNGTSVRTYDFCAEREREYIEMLFVVFDRRCTAETENVYGF